jgi:hypothetical protein
MFAISSCFSPVPPDADDALSVCSEPATPKGNASSNTSGEGIARKARRHTLACAYKRVPTYLDRRDLGVYTPCDFINNDSDPPATRSLPAAVDGVECAFGMFGSVNTLLARH